MSDAVTAEAAPIPVVADTAPVAVEQTSDAPLSTSDIAARSLEALEAADQPEPEPAPQPASEPAKTEPKSAEDQEIEALLAEYGFKEARKPDGREHYIPRSKVLKMIGSGLKRGQERWTAERGVVESQMSELRSHLDELRTAVSGDPRAFLAEIAAVDPRYQAFLGGQAEPERQARPEDMAPEPDLDLGNGARTYSPDGLRKLLEFQVNQALKPYKQQEAQLKQRQMAEQLQQTVQTTIQEAEKWEEFGPMAQDGSLSPFQMAVLEKLKADSAAAQKAGRRPTMSLRQAYLEALNEKRAADLKNAEATALQRLQSSGPTLTRTAPDTTKGPAPRSTSDIAARVLQRLEKAG